MYSTGYYQVGNNKYSNKIFAAIDATATNQDMTWHFHDEIFANVKPIGISDIKLLYKARAQQLRDKYDYLILNFSGGSDSWTVLNSFLENNIKLDRIFVKWPMKAVDKGFYKPNSIDTSAFNFASEWDLVIKHDLHWISQHHPEIEIEIGDWLDNLNQDYFNDDLFADAVHHHFMTNLLRVPCGSVAEKQLVEKGKKVGSIYGVDKPAIVEHDNNCYFFFRDGATTTCPARKDNPDGTEYFYWTPDMPQIAIEQAYMVFQWYKNNKQNRNIITSYHNSPEKFKWDDRQTAKNFQDSISIIRSIIYPDWDQRKFQADKPVPLAEFDGKQKDFWLETRPEMQEIKKVWKYYWKSYIDKIDQKYMNVNKELKISRSRYYYLGRME